MDAATPMPFAGDVLLHKEITRREIAHLPVLAWISILPLNTTQSCRHGQGCQSPKYCAGALAKTNCEAAIGADTLSGAAGGI